MKEKFVHDTTLTSISSLHKILEQESYNLQLKAQNSFISSLPDEIDKQLVFAQQMHIRATDLQENGIIQRSREYLQSTNSSFFNLLWAKVRDKSALIRTMDYPTSYVKSVASVAVTPDSTKIVFGFTDNTIKIWDLTSGGRLVNTLRGHTSFVNSVAVTPDSTKIVSGSC